MNLAFREYWPKTNIGTNFVEKLWSGFLINNLVTAEQLNFYAEAYKRKFFKPFFGTSDSVSLKPKLTSIREDKNNLWKPGRKIHFIINNRTKNRFQFAPVIEVKKVQHIHIDYYIKDSVCVFIDDELVCYGSLKDKNRFFSSLSNDIDINNVAVNDGFDSVQQFFNWFDRDFTGKIIHWTDLRYK